MIEWTKKNTLGWLHLNDAGCLRLFRCLFRLVQIGVTNRTLFCHDFINQLIWRSVD